MGEGTKEGIEATGKKKKKKKKKKSPPESREESVYVPRRPYRDTTYDHNKSAHQQSVDGWNRICGFSGDDDDNFGY